jgi:hypothetical protein
MVQEQQSRLSTFGLRQALLLMVSQVVPLIPPASSPTSFNFKPQSGR